MGIARSGSTKGLHDLLFPSGFSGEVVTLIMDAWRQLKLPSVVTKETPITALFRDKMLKVYDPDRIHFISLEDPITDPDYGTELGRNDLRFYPVNHRRQTVFFTVECKRLHTASGPLIGEYIKAGVMRFLTDGPKQYSRNLPCGAMLGYVLDGDTQKAFASLRLEIEKQKSSLFLLKDDGFQAPSNLLAQCPFSADSRHMRQDKVFSLHHILVPINVSGKRATPLRS